MNNITQIKNTLPDSIFDLSEKQLLDIFKMVKIDQYKNQAKTIIKESEFDLYGKIDLWLKNKASHTRRMYYLYIQDFIKFLGDKNVLSVDRFFVDSHIVPYIESFTNGKGRLYFSAISSFYGSLVMYGDMNMNPFKGVELKDDDYKEEYIPITMKDAKALIDYFHCDTEAHHKMRVALHMMMGYGVRVGFFNKTVHLEENGIIRSWNKGKWYKVDVSNDDYIKSNMDTIKSINSNTVRTNIRNATISLHKNGKIDKVFTAHSLRHLFAIEYCNRTKDLYRLSRILNHSDIRVTQVYLKGIGVKEENYEIDRCF